MKNSNHQYPPQTGPYAVKVKNGRGWNSYSTARFQISVGQEYHEGDKFKATMQWAKHRFEKVIICVNDTLQRHNYLYDGSVLNSEQAFLKAEAAGREWLERNLFAIRTLPNFEIYRWEEWRSLPEYEDQYKEVISLYTANSDFRDTINQEIKFFWDRKKARTRAQELPDYGQFKKASTDYLIEETVAFFLMFQEERAVDVYPGSILLPCAFAEKYLSTPGRNLGDRAFTRIDFSKNDNQKRHA